ncbi:hypothetical protein J7E83_12375 [Arthrobacter sp. ISL-48]|uniref:hypothetical protein n=1 Tax=Arthrobacter sp. ISL-48 TaxID=2819110 RepID=UPI001BE7DF95|nr:hypothetical protein [Arthrobacter sp. ISL-48]MBT2532903.1 hypothetical protein [Arthrobacter sp. ISL-48]
MKLVLKTLYLMLFIAGYISIYVVGILVAKAGDPELGSAIVLTTIGLTVVALLLWVGSNNSAARAAKAGTVTVEETAAFNVDPLKVWSVIRPAESAVLFSDAQRAFTVPGTPLGVGEQQCFIGRDGAACIIEVIDEEVPRWAATKTVTPTGVATRQTYKLEPTPSGCTLTMGAAFDISRGWLWSKVCEKSWRKSTRKYLDRLSVHLTAQQ